MSGRTPLSQRPAGPGRWLVVRVVAGDEADRFELGERLVALGATSVVEEGEVLVTYLPLASGERAAVAADTLRERLGARAPLPLDLTWSETEDQEWDRLWKEGLGPRRVTEQILVTPSWCAPEARAGEIRIVIDPGIAFGTAEHGSTRTCLRLLEQALPSDPRPRATPHPGTGPRIADVGTGSGILAIAAGFMGAGRVVALEVDEAAAATARENVANHDLSGCIEVLSEEVSPGRLRELAPLHGIVSNIESAVLLPLLEPFRAALPRSSGWLVVGGILEEEAATFVEAAIAAGFTLREEDIDEGWWGGLFDVALIPGRGPRPPS